MKHAVKTSYLCPVGHRKRFYATFGNDSFNDYIEVFDKAAQVIESKVTNENGLEWHPMVTYDGSSQYFWEHDGWEVIPQNVGQLEPKVTLIDGLRSVRPDAKLILMLRNPEERLFSHFWMLGKNHKLTADDFHAGVLYSIEKYKECFEQYGERKCLYDTELFDDAFRKNWITLRTSIYSGYLKDWVKVFKSENILVIKSEDYYIDRTSSLNKIYEFIGLQPISEDDKANSINKEKAKFSSNKKPRMLNKTRQLLRDFYAPYNRDLATMLNDDRFLWS
ncbi:hypothetical protein CAPTEDRAFT_206554 [Capitella teleta]|uniref:Sulfotransferase domain-containing protein n=1 Tax=Capitella teleta TaxID=283909 RepID=R7U1B7_CAPTE|nr:hypothetical protein CAPTEDRAFT_206554 [Capitella teleta]|eukprot:ELU00009.1 hypothetical protein CAPTEDRAFT_206554 [Capitella teleta]